MFINVFNFHPTHIVIYSFLANCLFFTSKVPEIKINQILLCKVNLGIFGHFALQDCHGETQLKVEDTFSSKTV